MMTSTDLPTRTAFREGDRVAIIAGSGDLPIEIAETLSADGRDPFVIIIEGEGAEDGPLSGHEHVVLDVEALGRLPGVLRKHRITHVVLAGGVARRPKLRNVRLTRDLLLKLPQVIAALARGDNGLLSLLVRAIESFGFKVVGAHEILPELLAPVGALTRAKPLASDRRDLDAAFAAARAIGALDIGQAAIAIGGRTIAVEGVEGTDGLLARTRELRGHGRLAGKHRGVLVKCAKPGQELRADLPSIGPDTVDAAFAAGLAGIGVEAGRSLIINGGEVVARANKTGLFIIGLSGAAS